MKINALLFLSVLLLFGLLIVQGEKQNELEQRIAYTDANYFQMKVEMEESEARCQRMTDTCIDIITNRRWENGE